MFQAAPEDRREVCRAGEAYARVVYEVDIALHELFDPVETLLVSEHRLVVLDSIVDVHSEAVHGHDFVGVVLDKDVGDAVDTLLLIIPLLRVEPVQRVGAIQLSVRGREVHPDE